MKFKYGDRVKVIEGFYVGQHGTLCGQMCNAGHYALHPIAYKLEEFMDYIPEAYLEKVGEVPPNNSPNFQI